MTDLFLVLTPVLLSDVANPVLFGLLVYLAAGPRGALVSFSALLGHTVAYFGSGVLIAFAFAELTEFMSSPGNLGYGLGGALGLALVYVAWLSRGSTPEPAAEQPAAESPGSAFVTGAIVNFVGIPFGLPYFVAIDQILKADVDLVTSLALLGGYNLAYMLPFLLVPVLTGIMGANARALLAGLSARVEKVAELMLPLLLAGLGLFLILDATLYFLTGEGLY